MGVVDNFRERQELRHELYVEFHANHELAKNKAGQQQAVINVLARRKMAAGREAIDPVKIQRWLDLLMKLLPLILALFK